MSQAPEVKVEIPSTCEACGRKHVTAAQGKFFVEKCSVPPRYFALCDACKREKYAKKFAGFLKGVQG